MRRGPGARPQEVFEATEIVRPVAVHERDADARVNGKTTVLPGEHVCGGSGVEEASKSEPTHDAACNRSVRAAVIDCAGRNTGRVSAPCRNTPSVTYA